MTPILRRELLEVLRTRKAVALQIGLALVCALLVLVRWPTGDLADLSGVRSLQVLRMFGYGLLAGILVLVPAFPATTLVREKIKGTLALLLNSPLRPWSIYAGKLGGVLGFAAVLLVMTLPAAGACYALGGTVVQGGITALYVVLGLAALQLSALALLVSSRSQSPDSALRTTYALVLALCFLALVPYALLRGDPGPLAQGASWLRFLSPIPAVMGVLGHGDVGSVGLSAGSEAVWRYALLALLTSLLFAVATVARLNHSMLDRARPAGVMTEDRSAEGRAVRRVLFLVDPRRRSGAMSLWINPVMVKEFRSRRFGRSHWMLRLIALSIVLSLALSIIALTGALGWGVEVIGGGLVLLQVALLILFAPSLGAGLVSAERERGTWQLLRMTPLRPAVILRGKLLSVVWPLLLLLAATLPVYMIMMTGRSTGLANLLPDSSVSWPRGVVLALARIPSLLVEAVSIPQVQRVVACLALTSAFAVLVSAAASTVFRSTAAAMTVAYAVLLTLCVAPLLVWLGRDAPFGHATVEAALAINPVAAALQAAETPGFSTYELLPLNWWITGSACVALLAFLGLRTWQLCRPE
jgi:ABC-type transport system involved in multi-copper enzyme maturation permease subunit